MPDSPGKLSQFWQELKRRKVTRTITVYAAAAFVILELVSIIVEPLKLPEWTLPLIIVLLCVGFIIAIILSWIYDVHPEGGIVKTEPSHKVKEDDTPKSSNSWKIASYISFVVIVGLIVLNIIPRTNLLQETKILAVLPFENWSADEANSHLGNALANEIITELSKVRDFHVVSYTSASRYKDKSDLSIPQIGRELGANFIIEGTVERQNDRVSIHVQVIQAENDNNIWANEYTGDWKDIFIIQDEIALNVAAQLEAVLTNEDRARIDENPTGNPEAYDFYLKGLYFYEEGGDGLNIEAISRFKEAIRLDSSFALPWTYLAMCYWRQTDYSRSAQFQKAKEANKRALELNPNLSIAIVNMAEILDNEYDFQGAEEQISLALKTDPNNQYVLRNAGRFYTILGEHAMSIAYCNQALKDDPNNRAALLYLMRAYFYSDQFENARATEKMLDKQGYKGNEFLHYQLLLDEGLLDMIFSEPPYKDAEDAQSVGLAAAYFISGDMEMGEKQIIRLRETGILYYHIAMAYAYGVHTEEVCTWLERSFEKRETVLIYLAVDPAFASYRNEPRIMAILQKMKLL